MKLATLLLSVFLLAGCQQNTTTTYTLKVAAIASSVAQLDRNFDMAKESVRTLDGLTLEQWEVLNAGMKELSLYRDAIKGMVSGDQSADEILVSITDVIQGYDAARVWYTSVRDLVVENEAQLKPATRILLRKTDQQAKRFDTLYQQLITAPNGSQIDVTLLVQDILNIAATGVLLANTF